MDLPPSPDSVIDALRDLTDPASQLKDTSTVHARAGALFARLKALNRAANVATKAHKQATADARHHMDQTHLELQNLLYEKRHLEREIDKCRQFASIYQDIPMYTVDQFVELAPPEAHAEDVMSNQHQLMLNRLSFELQPRHRLDQRVKELTQQKEELLRDSKSKLVTMESVKVQIDTLVKTASEIRKKVDELVPSTVSPVGTPLQT
ncbi:hypothetical protein HETIRDRAFT_449547 [Heterobasidion irregulare TC 32-1]|uniref:Fms interacting protein n=1 Tax=Heterobasidion irregulare (strain TC 32-1) TaxID=747525 RepID=W4KF53_HETIT|nr:uncharacterized protein HETIRDRAFT_449547 [Heterobasidion irregulare TC 32-1]ETW83940.1 hypothetical protein HETIRDRAFT_449547 [Heterobasidion irregulare TC 32-1]